MFHCIFLLLGVITKLLHMHSIAPYTPPQMQVRFDGMLGFPGGMVDKGETPAQAVTREFNEEVGCSEGLVTMTTEDHVCTHYSHHTRLCLHFFAKEVSSELYLNIERCPQSASHWGIEVGVLFTCTLTHAHTHTHTQVFGVVRVPLYTLPNGLGLPGFLRNAFIGNSRCQLGLSLVRRGMLTQQEWEAALQTSRAVTGLVTKEEIDY